MDIKHKGLLIKTNVRAGCGDDAPPPPPDDNNNNAPLSLPGNRTSFLSRVRSFFMPFR